MVAKFGATVTRYHFRILPVRVSFSKSTVNKICRQKMSRLHVNGRPICHIFHRFQNVPTSCERSLTEQQSSKDERFFVLTRYLKLSRNQTGLREFSTYGCRSQQGRIIMGMQLPITAKQRKYLPSHRRMNNHRLTSVTIYISIICNVHLYFIRNNVTMP